MTALILGAIASLLLVALAYSSQQRTITTLTIALSVVVAAQYYALDKPSAAAVSIVSLVFALAALVLPKSRRTAMVVIPVMALATVVVSFVAAGAPANGFEFVPVAATVVMSALPFLSATWVVKLLQLVGGLLWTVYMVYAGAWGQLPGEVFYFVAWGVAVVKIITEVHSTRSQPVAEVTPGLCATSAV